MLYEEWKSRYKNLKNFNTVLQRCPRFWPLAPPRGMNPGVYSLGISEDPPRYLSSKFDASVRSDCWDISIWKTLTQCDGNGNANANANVDDLGDYNSSPCTSYRRAKKQTGNHKSYPPCQKWQKILVYSFTLKWNFFVLFCFVFVFFFIVCFAPNHTLWLLSGIPLLRQFQLAQACANWNCLSKGIPPSKNNKSIFWILPLPWPTVHTCITLGRIVLSKWSSSVGVEKSWV